MWFPDPITEIQTYFIGIAAFAAATLATLRLRRYLSVRRQLRHKRTATIAPKLAKPPAEQSGVKSDATPSTASSGDKPSATSDHDTPPKTSDHDTLPKTSDVEFYVVFPREVSNRAPFTVYVCITNYTRPAAGEISNLEAAPDSLVADVPSRGFISVALESTPLEVDAPLQSLVWRNRDTIAGFVLHPTGIRRRMICANQVWIAVNGVVRGRIRFDIEVDPRMKTSTAKPVVVDHSRQVSESIGQQVVSLLTTEGSRAQAVKNAFVCYAHKDWHQVSYLAEALEAAGINIWIDALKMKRQPEWEEQAKKFVDDADLAYVCWSASAASSDSIVNKELEWIKTKLQNERAKFDAILVKMDQSLGPEWLEIGEGIYSKRWQFFRAGMREHYQAR